MDIRTYLCREGAAITDASLATVLTADDWRRQRPQRLSRYLDCMGLSTHLETARTPLNVQVTGVVQREGYCIEKLSYESLPGLYVTGNLYVPGNLSAPAPAVLYVCGHADKQKVYYQAHARRFCQVGFVTLLVETIQLGEIPGDHHGVYWGGRFNLYSRGFSPGAVEAWNGVRAFDLLAARPDVDARRMGVTGNSGGGATSWWLGAADERAQCVAPSCGTGTMRSHVAEKTVDGHCDCMFHVNTDLWDLADVGALIAPRPLLVATTDRDHLYCIDAIRETVSKVRRVYDLLDAGECVDLVEAPGPHGYQERTRTRIFSWFLKHLAHRDVPPEEVGDYSPEASEPEEALRVFAPGFTPADERTTTVEDYFVPRAELRPCCSAAEVRTRKQAVVGRLRELTFHHFPQDALLEVEVIQRYIVNETSCLKFRFTGEAGWRHSGHVSWPEGLERPSGVLLTLPNPRGEDGVSVRGLSAWATASAETRGVGDLSWGEELSWHVRRGSAIIGRTVASMRVYDMLRALQALRTIEGVDPRRVALAARGEMVPVALYAALLDGNVPAVVMQDPPPTQDLPSRPDGRGESIEMLSCLRITDLPEVTGLLWPAELVFVGYRPESYQLAEETYRAAGAPGAVRHVNVLAEWGREPKDLPVP